MSLFDATSIKCRNKEYDLSFLKLLEHGKTFYMKFGFKFDINDDIRYNEFSSAITKKNYVKNLVKKCRKLRTSKLITFYKKLLKTLNKCKNKECIKYINTNDILL